MRVLHVVDRVLARLLARQIEVQVDGRVVRACQQIPARGVHADLRQQVVQRDELTRPLGHLRALARPDQVHELHDQQLQPVGIASQRAVRGLHPRHVTVVVGAPHVDLPIEAALAPQLVVGDIGGEVGVLAVRAHQHAVLVVAEVRRAQPQRPLAAVGAPLLLEDRQRARHRARIAIVQRALILPAVEARHREGLQRAPHLGHDQLHRRPSHGGRVHAVGVDQLRQLAHVLAPVAVLGQRLAARKRAHRLAQLEHLRARVVDVELALHLMSVPGEHARERIAIGRVACVTHVHRSGRVGRDEFDQDALAPGDAAGAELLPCGQRVAERVQQPGIGQEQVHEPWTRDLDALQPGAEPALQRAPQPPCHLARRGSQARRQQQRGVGRVVAEVRARRPLQRDPGRASAQLSHGLQHGAAQAA